MTTPVRENSPQEVAEGGTALLTWILKDEAGAPIPLTALNTLTWTHYNESDGSIINSRNAVNIKNANGGTVAATTGVCTLKLLPADNVLLDQNSRSEWKVAFIKGTYNAGVDVVEKEIAYLVSALRFSP